MNANAPNKRTKTPIRATIFIGNPFFRAVVWGADGIAVFWGRVGDSDFFADKYGYSPDKITQFISTL